MVAREDYELRGPEYEPLLQAGLFSVLKLIFKPSVLKQVLQGCASMMGKLIYRCLDILPGAKQAQISTELVKSALWVSNRKIIELTHGHKRELFLIQPRGNFVGI